MNCPNCGIELHIKKEQAREAAVREQKEKELKELFEWRCNNSDDEFGAIIIRTKILSPIKGFLMASGLSLVLFAIDKGMNISLSDIFITIMIGLIFGALFGGERSSVKKSELWQQFKDRQQFKQQY
ncbi:MAG: hypothetical protein Q8Q06_00825 [bacterium]|nr:hypothetical protein [bacterium]